MKLYDQKDIDAVKQVFISVAPLGSKARAEMLVDVAEQLNITPNDFYDAVMKNA